jgi:hypothetical protein
MKIHFLRCLALLPLLFSSAVFAADTPDFTTPEMQQLRASYLEQRATIAKQRTESLKKLLAEQIEKSNQRLNNARISGNVTLQASASTAIKIFADAKATFEKDGTWAITNTITRRDLEDTIALYKTNAQVIEDKQVSATKALDKTFTPKLGDLLTAQKMPVTDSDKLHDLLAKLTGVGGEIKTNTGAPATGTKLAPPPPTVVLAASSGNTNAAANWTPLMKLDINIRDAIEVIAVPLLGQTTQHTIKDTGSSGQPWTVQVTPYQEFVAPATAPLFRIQSQNKLKPVDIMTWPSARNNWTIEMRAQAAVIPSFHGIVIETDASACRGLVGGAGPADLSVQKVNTHFDSTPPGAYILINGKPLVADNEKSLLTPFEALVPDENMDITFRKTGFQDQVMKQQKPTQNATFRATLPPLAGFVEKTIVVSAANPEWFSTTLKVKKGDRVQVSASGSWTIGAVGESCDAEGYPNNDKFLKYYSDASARITKSANFGQLVARILPGGEAVAVGKQTSFTADADGALALCINAATSSRRDNKGQVSTRITVEPRQ